MFALDEIEVRSDVRVDDVPGGSWRYTPPDPAAIAPQSPTALQLSLTARPPVLAPAPWSDSQADHSCGASK